MPHANGLVAVSSDESRIQRNVANVAACDVKARELPVIKPFSRSFCGKDALPDARAQVRVGERERDDKAQAAQKRLVERRAHVGRQDGKSPIRLHPLQEVTDLDVCVAIMAVSYLTPFAE
jgi:hypothetical protein